LPPTVLNISPFIWLAKIGKLDLLKELFGEVAISEETYKEAVEKGLEEGFSGALVIKDAYEQRWIKVKTLNKSQTAVCEKIMQHSFELHKGEVQAIVLAREAGKDALLLMDDSSGRAFAEAWGLKVKGVLYTTIAALRNELLDKAQAKETVLTLVKKGFRILAVINPAMHPAEETQAVLGLFDGEMDIYEKETPEGVSSFLRIRRMTGQKYSKEEIQLTSEMLEKGIGNIAT